MIINYHYSNKIVMIEVLMRTGIGAEICAKNLYIYLIFLVLLDIMEAELVGLLDIMEVMFFRLFK